LLNIPHLCCASLLRYLVSQMCSVLECAKKAYKPLEVVASYYPHGADSASELTARLLLNQINLLEFKGVLENWRRPLWTCGEPAAVPAWRLRYPSDRHDEEWAMIDRWSHLASVAGASARRTSGR
jgi:hypothetical protein